VTTLISLAAHMQTKLNSQDGTVPRTSSRIIKEMTQNKITPTPFNDRNTCVVTDSQLQTPVINLSD
jgi:hypothetical protein